MLARPEFCLRYIPREQILSVWEDIGPLLNRPSERTLGLRTANEILDDALDGQVMLWVVHPVGSSQIVMAMETKEIVTSEGPICELVSLGGDGLPEWFDTILEQLEALAKGHGMTRIRPIGRPGWGRLMIPKGYRTIGVILEKVL